MRDLAARQELYNVHRQASSAVDSLFQNVSPSNVKRRQKKLATAVGDLRKDVQATVMGHIDTKSRLALEQRNQELRARGLPPLSDETIEKMLGRVNKQATSVFVGRTLNQRLLRSQLDAYEKGKNELLLASFGDKGAKARYQQFLTDGREGVTGLAGGSNFKWNDRILQSEGARADQNAGKLFLEETGLLGRWTLSPRHHRKDICDDHANGHGDKAFETIRLYALPVESVGAYAASEVPVYPHPFCECEVIPIWTEYGIANVTLERAFSNMGERVGRYGEALVSDESQQFYRNWLVEEYRKVRPYDQPRRSLEEVEKKVTRIEKSTAEGLDGTVKLTRNKGLASVIEVGGSRGYEELANSTIGSYLDSEVVSEMGVENAIKLFVREIKAQGKTRLITKSLEEYIEKELPIVMRRALADSKKYMDEADACRRQVMQGTPKRVVQALRTRALVSAKKELGDAIGYAEVHERLLRELKSKGSIDFIPIKVRLKEAGRVRKVLGIEESDARLLKKGNQSFVVLGKDAMKKVQAQSVQRAGRDFPKELDAIKSGRKNKKGWLPRGLQETFKDRVTGKVKPLELTEDQQTGIRFIKANETAFIHYKPGAGKTLTAIGSITELAAEGKVAKTLIVVPDNLVRQFRDDIDEFTNPDIAKRMRAMTYHNAQQRAEAYTQDNLITVISHSHLQRDAELLKKAGFDMVVVDEIHQLPKTAFDILDDIRPQYRVGMTGTAIRDSVSDLYEPVNWLSPQGVGSRTRFDARFKDITAASSVYQKVVLRDLRDMVKPLVITRESPVKARLIPVTRKVNLTPVQRVASNDIERRALAMKDAGKSKVQVEAWRDKQLGKVVNGGTAETNAKMGEVQRIIAKHVDDKVIIFASERESISVLRQGLGEEGVGYYTTEYTKAQRDKLIKEFRSNPAMRVLVLTDAGATGLNLEVANVAIHWDLPEKSFKLEQRIARNWRGTKTEDTYQYLLQTSTTYDARIKQSLDKTKAASESLKVAESMDELGIAKTMQRLTRRRNK